MGNQNRTESLIGKQFYPLIGTVHQRWADAWDDLSFRWAFPITWLAVFIMTYYLPGFLLYIQSRTGSFLNDPILRFLPAINVSVYIFAILYAVVLTTFAYLLFHPWDLLKGIQAYILIVALRMLSIYLVPLEPPLHIMSMIDPFVDRFFYDHVMITKDLFFSGHVSTLFLIYLVVDHKMIKRLFLAATVAVGFLLLIQHVHYTFDVITAPLVAWMSYQFVTWSWEKSRVLLQDRSILG